MKITVKYRVWLAMQLTHFTSLSTKMKRTSRNTVIHQVLGLLQSLRQPTVYQAIEFGGMLLIMQMGNLFSDTESDYRAATSSAEGSRLFPVQETQMLKPASMVQVHL